MYKNKENYNSFDFHFNKVLEIDFYFQIIYFLSSKSITRVMWDPYPETPAKPKSPSESPTRGKENRKETTPTCHACSTRIT